uniref:Polyribonucleotide 5'-hydroxyl-kinase Clp1 P-loop domain-containing protein n=1 Tax=Parascaris equorum TaxID=6256 RepID=A0A914R4Q8_PAREQ
MIIGGKSAGKSTSARYIANSLLGKDNAPVYFLDADVGQSEANPPGCVSLFRVESPMLVAKLYERFKSKAFPGSVLIVNTPGWVEGRPLFVYIHLLLTFLMRTDIFHRPMTSVPFTLTPAAIRNLLILGYMAPLCPTPSLGSLGDAAPYAVPFGRIAVNLNPGLGSVPDTHLLAVLNCAFVALCSVRWEEDHIKDVVLQCVGFGFIRAIDLNERLFYVLTPVAEEALPEVNVFAKGVNIDLPNVFFTQRRSVEAPYVLADNKGPASDMYSELAVISCHKRAQSNRRRI